MFRVQVQLPLDVQIHNVLNGDSVPRITASIPQPDLSFALRWNVDEDCRPRAAARIDLRRWRLQRFPVVDNPVLRERRVVYLTFREVIFLFIPISRGRYRLGAFAYLGFRISWRCWVRMLDFSRIVSEVQRRRLAISRVLSFLQVLVMGVTQNRIPSRPRGSVSELVKFTQKEK